MYNAHQQMAQAQLIFLEQNLMTSQFAIQQLRTYLGLPTQQQPNAPFNPNMGMGNMYDNRIKEKPQADLKPSAFWIESLKPSPDNEYFNIEFMKLGEVQSRHSYNTGFGNQRSIERYTHHGLFELGMKADDLLSAQITTLVTTGKLTADVVKAFRLDTDHILISVKSLGVSIMTTGVLEHLHESIEVMDLRRISTTATIKVDSELLDPFKRGPMGGHETGVSIEDLRGMAEESENSQPPVVEEGKSVVDTTTNVDNFPTDAAGNVAGLALDGVASLSYDPENDTEKLGGLVIDDVIFVGSAKTAFHQQYKFTYQHPTSGKLNVGVKPELLDTFIVDECDPITNRGLAVIIGKQNKLAFSDPKKAVFTLITFKESDNAIIQLVADTTRTYRMSKFDLARVADKITDSTYLRQIHVD